MASSVSRAKRSRKRSSSARSGVIELQRDRPLQAQVVGPVDDAHAAPTDQLLDPIADELGADLDLGQTCSLASSRSPHRAYARGHPAGRARVEVQR